MISANSPASARQAFLIGLAIAISGAILFSAKAIVAKLIYRYGVDGVTLITFRMLFSLPFFAVVAVWKARTAAPLTGAERGKIVVMGLLGYYLSSLLDFLGLPWDERCLEFGQAANLVKTASVWQVREKLHRSSSGRWRNYEHHLGRLQGMLQSEPPAGAPRH